MRKWEKNSGGGETGLDWVILSAALFATAVAVFGTVTQDRRAMPSISSGLTGELVWTVYSAKREFCRGGLEAVQAKEDRRVAVAVARGEQARAVDVAVWNATHYANRTDTQIIDAYAHGLNDITGPEWSRAATLSALLECELAARELT